MTPANDPSADCLAGLLDRVQAGDRAAVNELLAAERESVRRFLEVRMDARLRGRVDVSDVIQEAQAEVAERLPDYLARRPMPFRVWVLRTAHQRLLRLRRHHVEAECRAAGREAVPEATSVNLAERLAGGASTPSHQAVRRETALRVQAALEALPETDREVILLRTFDGLSNQEVAALLELDPDAASKRYTRALLKLRQALAGAE